MENLLKFLRNEKVRDLGAQLFLVAVIGFVVAYLTYNTQLNLEKRQIQTGFDFLEYPSGIPINQSSLPYEEGEYSYTYVYFIGLLNTLIVSFISIIGATVIGVLLGLCRISKNYLAQKFSIFYIETLRNIPILLQILFWYYIFISSAPNLKESISFFDMVFLNIKGIYLPTLQLKDWLIPFSCLILGTVGIYFYYKKSKKKWFETGVRQPVFLVGTAILIASVAIGFFLVRDDIAVSIPVLKRFDFVGGITMVPELAVLALALSLYTATYIAEAIRSGVEAVDYGQSEAALALGFSNKYNLKLIVIPQAVRIVIPPVTSLYLNIVKNSSLAAAIAFPDLVSLFSGSVLNVTGRAIEIMFMTMMTYLTINIIISICMNYYNKKISLLK